jgi:acyl carrier protein
MVTRYDAAEVANLAMRGMGSLGPDQGLEALGRLMTAGATQAAVLPVDWAQWHERYPALARAPFLQEVVGGAATSSDESPGREDVRATLAAASPEERAVRIDALVKDNVAAVMRIAPPDLDASQPLKDMGLDSLMAVEIRNRVEATLGVSLPLVSILEGPSVTRLAAVVAQRFAEAPPPSPAGSPAPARELDSQGRAGDLLSRVDQLSDSEVDSLLAEMAAEKREE